MVTRVQLDASHVSRCLTVRREKVHKYIRDSNELLRYERFRIHLLRLRELEYAEREFCTVPESSYFSLTILVVQSLTWASERDRPQRRRSVFCRFLRWINAKDES